MQSDLFGGPEAVCQGRSGTSCPADEGSVCRCSLGSSHRALRQCRCGRCGLAFSPIRTPDPPHSGIDTSREAASQIRPSAATIREQVYGCVKLLNGATCEQACDELSLPGNTVRPRLWELEAEHRVEKTTERRKTASGRWARVYRVIA